MPTQAELQKLIGASLTDSDVLELYNAQDPRLTQQLNAIAYFLVAMGKEVDVSEIEPFIKSRPRSIIADATNKGILPTGIACQHTIQLSNSSLNSVTLTQGRLIEDNAGGRPWRLMSSVTIPAEGTNTVVVEQSEYREVSYTIPITEIFHKVQLSLQDDMYLSSISLRDDSVPSNLYKLAIKWMNVLSGDYAFNLTMDSLQNIFIQFGDSDRAGITAKQGQVFTVGLTETYGEIDISTLINASLSEVNTVDEQKISIQFVNGGLIQSGSDPLTVDQLKTIAGYPSLYDESAVFLGNFDYLIKRKFMGVSDFTSVWNENIQEQYYGVSYKDINHLNICVVAKDSDNQENLVDDIKNSIAMADNLYLNRVNVKTVEEVPYSLTITGRLAPVHDIDTVKAQVKSLLIANFGKGQLSAGRWLQNGFNVQQISSLIRNNITAFQDLFSDFSITPTSRVNKPHEWVYMTDDSIILSFTKTAENVGSPWIF